MFVKRWIVVVAVLISPGTAGIGLAAGQSPDVGRHRRGQAGRRMRPACTGKPARFTTM